jgi:putative tricarboxylic transport membrane protein
MELFQGLMLLMNPVSLFYLTIGVFLFLAFGAVPGLGGPVAYAILIPLTYTMDPVSAFAILVGGHSAVMFGGSISAILINTPGTGQNVATTFDGYPLTQQGRAGEALGAAATASAMGSIIGAFFLAALIPVMRKVVLLFGSPELFIVCIFGLTTIAAVSKGSFLKGLVAGVLGLLLSFVGFDPVSGDLRYTFGTLYLWEGVELIPMIVGLFAIGEVMHLATEGGSISKKEIPKTAVGVLKGVRAVFTHWFLMVRCAIIGTIIGIIPGAGGAVANVVSYGHAVSTSKHPEKFGTGIIEGVIASETANDAKDGGALIPTIAFGIPGSETMAILLGAFLIQGLQPGPQMLTEELPFLFSLVWMIVLGGILGAIIGLCVARKLTRLTMIRFSLMTPFIIAVALLGSYSSNGSMYDVLLTVILGFLGYGMKKYGYPRGPVVIGLVLGHIVEKNFHLSLQLYGWNFLTRPLTIGLLILLVTVAALPFLRKTNRRKA